MGDQISDGVCVCACVCQFIACMCKCMCSVCLRVRVCVASAVFNVYAACVYLLCETGSVCPPSVYFTSVCVCAGACACVW